MYVGTIIKRFNELGEERKKAIKLPKDNKKESIKIKIILRDSLFNLFRYE